jgi:membrane-bound lytic murein transglycosylase D
MKKLWAVALLLLIGGCLPASTEIVTRAPAVAPPPAPSSVATPAPSPATSAASLLIPILPPAAGVAESDVALPSVAASDPAASPDPMSEDDPELLEGDAAEEVEEVDPEAASEKEALLAADLSAPEEEGTSEAPAIAFDFPVVMNDKVRYFVDYFSGPAHSVFRRWLERSAVYLPMMRQVFAEEGLPQDLVYLSMIESGYNPRAYSRAHASGLWQFIDSTGRLYGLGSDWWRDERRDPVKATRAAARHLRDLYVAFGDWYLAGAAYNAGAGKIQRGIEAYGTTDFWQLSHGRYLATETKQYVPKLLAAMLIAKEPEKYGFTDVAWQEPLAYETVRLPTAADVEIIAGLCDSSPETIRDLNPEIKRWCTPPGIRDYEVRLPAGSGEGFLEKYEQIPEDRRVNFQHHTVRKGETLKSIARRYGLRSKQILALNRVNPRSLKVGTELLLPFDKRGKPMVDVADRFERTAASTYKVRKGDSLYKIARRFEVSEQQLRSWNNLGKKNLIRPGQTLIVAAGKATPAKKATVAAQSSSGKGKAKKTQVVSAKGSAGQKIVYRVQKGDTLYAIARQYNVGTDEIMGWNNLRKGHMLRPGDRLTLRVRDDRRGG